MRNAKKLPEIVFIGNEEDLFQIELIMFMIGYINIKDDWNREYFTKNLTLNKNQDFLYCSQEDGTEYHNHDCNCKNTFNIKNIKSAIKFIEEFQKQKI